MSHNGSGSKVQGGSRGGGGGGAGSPSGARSRLRQGGEWGHGALPDWLCRRRLGPERVRAGVTVAALAAAVQVWFDSPERVAALEAHFTRVHEQLRGGANDKAADAIAALLAPGTGTQDHA